MVFCGNGERLGDVACGNPVRLVLYQQAKDFEPGRLRQRREGEDGVF